MEPSGRILLNREAEVPSKAYLSTYYQLRSCMRTIWGTVARAGHDHRQGGHIR